MAEYVQYRTEETIPELEEMQRIGLFQSLELRSIVKRRKELEYKIQRRTKCKEDYLRYIQFEINLLMLIKLRRKKSRKFLKKAEIEHTITNRVDKLFWQVVQRFKDDVVLWLSHIKFCKDVGFTSAVSSIIVRMLAVHSDKPDIWKMAADWEFTNCHSVENARKLLQRSLRFHPDSQCLYKEAFHLELKNVQNELKLLSDKEEEMKRYSLEVPVKKEDPILKGQLAEIVYACACDAIKDVQFSLDCLAIAAKFDFTQSLQDKIIKNLGNHNQNNEQFWSLLAKRARKGLPINAPLLGDDKRLFGLDIERPNEGEKLVTSVAVYEKAVGNVRTEAMWSAYLNSLIEESRKFPSSHPRKLLLKKAYSSAHKAGLMQEKFYAGWIDLLQTLRLPIKAGKALTEATQRYPHSLDLWRLLLKWCLERNKTNRAALVHEQATRNLGTSDEKLLPFWLDMIRHYSRINSELVEEMFQKGLALGTAISQGLKPFYLDWININNGIEATRTGYELLSRQPPLSLELHEKMIEIELAQSTVAAAVVRRCFDLATHQFGVDSSDLWLRYGSFEVSNGLPQNSSSVYSRAIAALKPELVNDFIATFTLVRSGGHADTMVVQS